MKHREFLCHALMGATLVLLPLLASADFTLDDDGARYVISENGKLVAAYNYTVVKPKDSRREAFARSCYLHPVFGLDGAVLTDDFPADHLHHRGIFWAWPRSASGGREVDVWSMKGARQRAEGVEAKEADATHATLAVRNIWSLDDAPDKPLVREHVRMTFLPATESSRAIDVEIRLENVSGAPFTLGGQTDADKGYGGMCIRPAGGSGTFSEDESRSPFRFLGEEGVIAEDRFEAKTPWAAVLLKEEPGQPRNGMALIEHPGNPGFPHQGWLLRHYGFLGQSWPHRIPHTLAPDESVTLRYRVLITRGLTLPEDFKPLVAAYTTPPEK